MTISLSITPKRVTLILTLVTVFLLIATVVGQYADDVLSDDSPLKPLKVLRIFAPIREDSVGTWFESALFALCATLLATIAYTRKRETPSAWWLHWAGLSGIFLMLSIDEVAGVHERLTEPMRRLLDVEGLLSYAWVVPGAILVLILAAVYLRFFVALPPQTRTLFLVSAVLFVSGSLGVEMLSGWYADVFPESGFGYAMLQTVEETGELTGLTVFIYALMSYIRRHIGCVNYRISFEAHEKAAA